MALILGLAIALLGLVLWFSTRSSARRVLGLLVLLIGLGVALISQSFVVVPAGQVGVVFNVITGVQPRPLGEGFHVLLPVIQEPVLYDARLQEVTLAIPLPGTRPAGPSEEAINARSKEGLDIGVDVTIQYRVKREEAPLLHQNVGATYLNTLIVPQIRAKIRDAVGQFNAADLISTQRTQLEAAVTGGLREALEKNHVELISVLLRRIDIPQSVAKAIEEKQTAEQQVQVAENRRRQAEIDAQRAVVEAKGQRDSAVLRAEGEARSIQLRGEALRASPQVVQLTVAEKLAPGINTIMLPSDGNFLLNLSDLQNLNRPTPTR